MKLNNNNISKSNQPAVFKTAALAMLFVFGTAQLAAAQELLAMLSRSSISVVSYDPADTNTVKAKPAETPVFDIMGSGAPLEESLINGFCC
jgi:hypothetical protein